MKGIKVSNETKVGALTAIAITVLVLGYNFLKGKDLFTKTNTFYAVYERVDGLAASNPVTLKGLRVGQVINVQLLPQDSMRVKVTFEINEDVVVRDSSVAKIYNADFFGSKAIELLLSEKEQIHKDGDQLVSFMEPSLVSAVSTIVAPLKEKTENLVVSLDSIVGGESGKRIQLTIANLSTITSNFKTTSAKLDELVAEQSRRLDDIFANVQAISQNLKNNNENISAALLNIRHMTDSLAAANLRQTITNAENALAEVAAITEKINKGEGSVGLLVNDKELYENLKNSSASLDALLKDMKEHPKRYVHFSIFGRKDKKEKKK